MSVCGGMGDSGAFSSETGEEDWECEAAYLEEARTRALDVVSSGDVCGMGVVWMMVAEVGGATMVEGAVDGVGTAVELTEAAGVGSG